MCFLGCFFFKYLVNAGTRNGGSSCTAPHITVERINAEPKMAFLYNKNHPKRAHEFQKRYRCTEAKNCFIIKSNKLLTFQLWKRKAQRTFYTRYIQEIKQMFYKEKEKKKKRKINCSRKHLSDPKPHKCCFFFDHHLKKGIGIDCIHTSD